MAESIDRENSVIITTLPNGDHYRVRTEAQRKAIRDSKPRLRVRSQQPVPVMLPDGQVVEGSLVPELSD